MGNGLITIKIKADKKRLLEMEKMFNSEFRSIDDVIGSKIDFSDMEKRFKKLLQGSV